ncbi:MAG: carboxypeptidase regulatory-like domain-containing protein, partial [Chloroflexi bacterium]|nr:carboxypeptidase regulatory-like domain-containing protein [Chloroflexota bacterium]
MKINRWFMLAATLALLLLSSARAGTPANAQGPVVSFTGFPDSDPTSGRFVNLVRGNSSLGEAGTNFEMGIPSSLASFQLQIFDGDMNGTSKWDVVTGPDPADQVWYTLYADPNRSGNTTSIDQVGQWSSTAMPDSDWFSTTVPNGANALGPDGNYNYNLVVSWQTNNVANEINNFKVRVQGQIYVLAGSSYGFIGYTINDTGDGVRADKFKPVASYNGLWQFYVNLTGPASFIDLWDGDFDRDGDIPDPNSPPFPPFPYASTTITQTVNPAFPRDDSPIPTSANLITPSIYYNVTSPDASWTVTNTNPSASQEWELFRIAVNTAFSPDAVVPALPAGQYSWQIKGVDGRNTLFIHALYDLNGELGGAIGDTVWVDTNGNGIQDNGEPGIPNVKVDLWVDTNGDGTVDTKIQTKTTDGNGHYLFTSLATGTYEVRIDTSTLPAGLAQTYDYDGLITPDKAKVFLPPATTNLDLDFGYSPKGSIGDFVWYDANSNGLQDDGATGIGGVKVNLTNLGPDNTYGTADDTTYPAQTTDVNGAYLFTGLPAGKYRVDVDESTLPPGLGLTTNNEPMTVTLTAGQNFLNADFGYVQQPGGASGGLGDYVWLDTNGNGVQDDGNTGIDGVTVRLYENLGGNFVLIMTDTTHTILGQSGLYSFGNLPEGTYSVRVDYTTLPLGYLPTYDLDGIATPDVALATLGVNEFREDVDFGYKPFICPASGTIGDTVWTDTNGDGVQNNGETGIPNVEVRLQMPGTTNQILATTDANGHYLFTNLPAGTYTVTVVSTTLPAGLTQTYDLDGLATPHTASLTLPLGGSRLDADFGYRPLAKIGDYVWKDLNGDGIQNEASSAGVNGVVVQLLNGSNQVISTTTTANNPSGGAPGWYQFSVAPGTYKVKVADSNFNSGQPLVGLTDTLRYAGGNTALDSNGDNAHTSEAITVNANDNITTIDFGYKQPDQTGDICLQGSADPTNVGATIHYVINPSANTVTVRVTLRRSFADAAYGSNSTSTGWPGTGRKFDQIVTSDQLGMILKNGAGTTIFDFDIDLLGVDGTAPSGYRTLGVT